MFLFKSFEIRALLKAFQVFLKNDTLDANIAIFKEQILKNDLRFNFDRNY